MSLTNHARESTRAEKACTTRKGLQKSAWDNLTVQVDMLGDLAGPSSFACLIPSTGVAVEVWTWSVDSGKVLEVEPQFAHHTHPLCHGTP